MTSTITINAAPGAVFAVLADPTAHAAIDGTGWVRDPLDRAPLTHAGQFFLMGMYHENHPDKNYEIANRVEALEPPRTTVTLTYDWSAATPEAREVLPFPPFGVDHLERSLQHLSDLAAA